MQKNIINPGRYKKRILESFGVDYFKIYIEEKTSLFKPKLLRLGMSANSNIYYYDDDTYIELIPDNKYYDYYFTIRDKATGVNLGFFLLLGDNPRRGAVQRNNVYEVTGQGLILRNIKFYKKLLNWAGFNFIKFKRIDLYFNIKENLNYLYKKVLKKYLEGKTKQIIEKKGNIETIYIGEKNTLKNTYQLIRIYDKLADTRVKKKEFLYDFENLENLTRFEVELRRDKAQFFKWENLENLEYIFGILYKTFYKMNYQYFKFLHFEDFKINYEEKEKLRELRKKRIKKRLENMVKYGQDWKDEKDKQRTISLFLNSAKRLYKNGINIEELLQINIFFEGKNDKN